MSYLLGIDIGTFESKGVLTRFDGSIVASTAVPHRMQAPQAGYAEHDAQTVWWADFKAITHRLLAESCVDPTEIRSIGCSGIGPCMLPVDKAGMALRPAVLYGVDTRAHAEIEHLNVRIGEEVLLRDAGVTLTSQSVGPKVLWLKRNEPEIYARAAKIVTCSTYLVQKLTGECVIDHYSAGGFSPLYDINRRVWNDALGDGIIETSRLPRLLWSTDVAGTVTPQAAAESGLAAGTPVTAGTIDAGAEALSVGVAQPGDLMLMYGSTIFIVLVTQSMVRDLRLWYQPWLFDDAHASTSGLATSGTLTRWFKDHLARDLDEPTAFSTLVAEAARSTPGANGVITLPYFSGERTPIHDPFAKGLVFGLNLTHTRADLYRSMIEGIGYGVNHIMETYRGAGTSVKRIVAVGGGTKNSVWLNAVSDIIGLEQHLPRVTFGASYGDALMAGIGVGAIGRDAILRWNPIERIVTPNPETREIYHKQYAIYKDLYLRTADLMRRLS